ncbi:MAG: PRC-barrel domain-containing protein [Candidatus Nezhaarchaeota archaeon]|nr:PRC-barrel domain-containing protein [Candidatus Nezhaarchaeota archaeon]
MSLGEQAPRQPRERSVTRERLIGMQVVDGEGYLVGAVKDISFAIGRMGISLLVEGKDGSAREIPWEDVQSVGDFVLLKPRPAQAPPAQAPAAQQPPQLQERAQVCPTCGGSLSWISQYQRWYCYKCRKYV